MIRIRAALTARRHALAVVSAIVALGIAVTLVHGAGADHMGDMAGTDGSHTSHSTVITMCLAVLEAAAAGAALLALWRGVRRPLRLRDRRAGSFAVPIVAAFQRDLPKARAGPALLQVYRL